MSDITKENILSCRSLFRFTSAGRVETVHHSERDNTVYVEGWALCHAETPAAVPEALFVISDGVCIYETREFSVRRRDVEEYYNISLSGDGGKEPGFAFTLENIPKEKIEGLTFLAASPKGLIYQLDYHTAAAQIEICGSCNMRCPQCPNVRMSGFNSRELTPEEFKLGLGVIDRSRSVCFDGFGESFLSKKIVEITGMIPWFKELKFHTNGILLAKNQTFLLQNAPPIHQCIVSMDSLKSERYAIFRPGGNLRKIYESMFVFKKQRECLGQTYPLIVPNLTVNGKNYDELPAFLELALQLDRKLEIALPFDPYGTAPASMLNNDAAALYEEILPRYNLESIHITINELLQAAHAQDVEVMLQGFILGERPSEHADALGSVVAVKDIQDCPVTNGTTVQSDGKGMLCPWQTRPVFNWRTEGTMDPRKTRRGQEVIRAIKEGRIPAECSGSCCPYVGRRQSSEPYEPVPGDFAGGWQIY
jgi:MoaA/NifB/PqqE/SkfB family radical SAM enzyme